MGKYGVNISYKFVVYIHRYLFSCITAVLTNQADEAVLIKNVLHFFHINM